MPSCFRFCFFIAAFFWIGGCSLPQIVVIDDPLTAAEHQQLGRAYEAEGRFDLAEKEYSAAARKLPQGHLLLGNLYFVRKEYIRAEESYREAIYRMPENPNAYNNLAWMFYIRRIRLQEAESLARRALILAPPDNRAPFVDTLEHILAERRPDPRDDSPFTPQNP